MMVEGVFLRIFNQVTMPCVIKQNTQFSEHDTNSSMTVSLQIILVFYFHRSWCALISCKEGYEISLLFRCMQIAHERCRQNILLYHCLFPGSRWGRWNWTRMDYRCYNGGSAGRGGYFQGLTFCFIYAFLSMKEWIFLLKDKILNKIKELTQGGEGAMAERVKAVKKKIDGICLETSLERNKYGYTKRYKRNF